MTFFPNRSECTVQEAPRQVHAGDDTSTFRPPASPVVTHHAAPPRGPPPPAAPQPLRLAAAQRPGVLAHALAARQPLQHAAAI